MNPWQQLIEKTVPDQSAPWPEPVKTNWRNLDTQPKADIAEPDFVYVATAPMMDEPCVCGLRYGMHRVGDYACPNQKWRPGNGKLQWMLEKWVRA